MKSIHMHRPITSLDTSETPQSLGPLRSHHHFPPKQQFANLPNHTSTTKIQNAAFLDNRHSLGRLERHAGCVRSPWLEAAHCGPGAHCELGDCGSVSGLFCPLPNHLFLISLVLYPQIVIPSFTPNTPSGQMLPTVANISNSSYTPRS
jgi:hypothetical protein